MKLILKRAFFTYEGLLGTGLGLLVRPFRPLTVGLFTATVGVTRKLSEHTTVLLSPFLMEFGRAALDNREPIWRPRMLLGGAIVRLDLTEKTQRNIFTNDIYEAGLTRFVVSVLRPGDVFVDVGANIGYYTLVAAAHVGTQGRVVACEPEEQNFRLLRANVEANDYENVRLLQTAVGDKGGTVTLHINPLNRGGNSVLPFVRYKTGAHFYDRVTMEKKFGRATLEQEVRMKTLDDVLDIERITSVRVLKIDVEGFEEAVFRGMGKALEKKCIEYILCEISTAPARNAILTVMKSAGYEPYRIDTKGDKFAVGAEYPRDIVFAKATKEE